MAAGILRRDGTILVSGAGSTLTTTGIDNTVRLGIAGTGDLTVDSGGLLDLRPLR